MAWGEWLLGGSRGSPTCALPLQLNQSLNDVLVSLEKQHGSNTFTVKAQPRCVRRHSLLLVGRGRGRGRAAAVVAWVGPSRLGLPVLRGAGEGTACPMLPWGGALAGQSAHHLSLATSSSAGQVAGAVGAGGRGRCRGGN